MKKMMFTLLTACLVMTLALSGAVMVSADDVLYGDLTGDGKVNNRDLGQLQQYINGYGNAIDKEAADVTHDGKINNRDLGLLQQFINGYDVNLQPEEPPVDDDDNLFNDTTLDWV